MDKIGREEREAAILAAALDCFAEQGFHGTNVPTIAKRAGLSVGTLYHYFPSKEAIVNALYRKLKLESARALGENFPFQAPPQEIIRELWRRGVEYAMANPSAFIFLEMHHHAPYLDEESRALEQQIQEQEEQLFAIGIKAGVFKPLPAEVLEAFIGGALRYLVKAAWQGRTALTPEVVDHAAACCWEAIRNPEFYHQ
jgi:AcrR family transcriptional regulator